MLRNKQAVKQLQLVTIRNKFRTIMSNIQIYFLHNSCSFKFALYMDRNRTVFNVAALFITSPPLRVRSIAMSVSVCLSVCLSARISQKITWPNFTKYSVRVTYCRCSFLLWRQCNTLFTSGFVNDVIFAHRRPAGKDDANKVYTQWLTRESPGAKCDIYDFVVLWL